MSQGRSVIPSSGDRGRIEGNFAAQEFVLDADEIESLRGSIGLVDGPWCPKWDV